MNDCPPEVISGLVLRSSEHFKCCNVQMRSRVELTYPVMNLKWINEARLWMWLRPESVSETVYKEGIPKLWT